MELGASVISDFVISIDVGIGDVCVLRAAAAVGVRVTQEWEDEANDMHSVELGQVWYGL